MNELVTHGAAGVILPREVIQSNINVAIAKMPDLISFDTTDPANELLALRCAVDMGVPAAQRETWRGKVCKWWVGLYEFPDEKSGEMVSRECLVLINDQDQLLRLTGWPAINSWCMLLRAAGAERCCEGIAVRVIRRKSSTTMGSYWQVIPDA